MLFIVQLSINDYNCNGHVEINQTQCQSILNIRSHHSKTDESNQTFFENIITKNFATVEFNSTDPDELSELSELSDTNLYKCIITDSPNTLTIIFDNSSHSAYSKFKELLEDCMNTTNETRQHLSGNISYVGTLLNKEDICLAHGKGVSYYDNRHHMIKYHGEFENGLYDGKGTFYNSDGKIKLEVNNISNGIPTQLGKLHYNYNKLALNKQIVEIDFSQFWKSHDFANYNKQNKQQYVLDDMFVDMVGSYYWKDTTKLSEVVFQDKTIEDKQTELWTLMNHLNTDTQIINKNVINIANNVNNINAFTLYQLVFNIMMFLYIVLVV